MGPSLGVIRMWTMKNDHTPRSGGTHFFNYKKNNFWIKSSLTKLFTSIDFSPLHFFSLHLSFNFRLLEPEIFASNGREEEDICFAFRIVHIFVHACKACGRHSSADFARKMKEISNFELGL